VVSRPTQFFTIDPEWALANDLLTPGPLSPKGERGALRIDSALDPTKWDGGDRRARRIAIVSS